MSDRYIGSYSDYISVLGSRRCCNVSSKDIPVVGPTGPPGPRGFVGESYTGPTGPAGVALVVNNSIIELSDNGSGCFVIDASNYFVNSWSINTSSTNITLSFQNFIINGIYRIYLTNSNCISSISAYCVSMYNNVSSELSPGKYIIDIQCTNSNTYYSTITGPYV